VGQLSKVCCHFCGARGGFGAGNRVVVAIVDNVDNVDGNADMADGGCAGVDGGDDGLVGGCRLHIDVDSGGGCCLYACHSVWLFWLPSTRLPSQPL
jgi:hypothetical protein